MFKLRKRSLTLIILALKTDYNNEKLMPRQLTVDVRPLLNGMLFKTRLIWG
jgi:hypothetical protein